MEPIYFTIIFIIALVLVTMGGGAFVTLSNTFKKIDNFPSPSKNDIWMFWILLYLFTLLIFGFLYCLLEIQTIKNKPGKKGEKGEKGEKGDQGSIGKCESC